MMRLASLPFSRDWLIPAGLLFLSAVGVAAMKMPAPRQAEMVAAVFPPWWTTQEVYGALTAAQAELVRTTAISSVVVVRPAKPHGRSRLSHLGAWFFADPQKIAACLQ